MKQMARIPVIIAIAGASICVASSAGAKEFYKMGTIQPGNSNYIVTAAFAQATNKYLKDYEIQVNATGTVVRHMLEGAKGDAKVFVFSSLIAYFMKNKMAMYRKIDAAPELYKNIRTVFSYPGGAYQFVVRESSGIKSLKDIKGKRVFVGPPSGGVKVLTMQAIKAVTGYVEGKDYTAVRLSLGGAQEAFRDNKIAMWTYPSMYPGAGLQQIALTEKIRLLSLDPSDFDKPAIKRMFSLPGRSRVIIPPKTYGENQTNTEPVHTFGPWLGVAVHKSMPDEVVYRMTKAFWDHIDDLYAQGKAYRVVTLDNALREVAQVHPGALRYYRERGVKIPRAAETGEGIPLAKKK